MAGKDVARVVNRCEDTKETQKLDLSQCELTQVPDAIFLILRSTTLTMCDLSQNLLKCVPVKLARNFTAVTDLKLNCNHLSSLSDEFRQMVELSSLDISQNRFSVLPSVVYEMPSLKSLKADDNEIKDVDSQRLRELPNLTDVNFKDNPLSPDSYKCLMDLFESKVLSVSLSPQDPVFSSVD